MDYIKIDKIKVNENIRKDYGDLTELTASVKEHGMTKPVELNKNLELVDGFRRLKVAKAAGLTEVPYFTNEGKIDNTTEQILSGIFSKNLNVVEEGNAFVKYMKENKISVKDFSKKISKSEGYVQKRIEIVTLPKEITEEIISKKLEIGHALLLKKMPESEAKKYAKEILREKYNVEEAKERSQYKGGRLSDAKFNKEDCKNCKFNGSCQSELFETGKILNGTCMNPGCFIKKKAEFIKKIKEEYKDILFEGKDQWSTPNGFERMDYSDRITKKYAEECRKTREQPTENKYLVKISDEGEIEEWFKIPPKKEEAKEPGENAKTEPRNVNSLNEFKTKFLIDKSIELMQPGTKEAKVLTLIQLISKSNWQEMEFVKKRFEGMKNIYKNGEIKVKNISDAKEKEIDQAISILSESAFRRVDMKGLLLLSEEFGVDLKKHFVITEEFLKIHTKAQLLSMIKELGIKTDQEYDDVKKDDMISYILSESKRTKGKIPKILK